MSFVSLAARRGRHPAAEQFRIGVEKRGISFRPAEPDRRADGRKVTKNAKSTGPLLDDKPATLDEIIAETNRLNRLGGDDEISFTAAA